MFDISESCLSPSSVCGVCVCVYKHFCGCICTRDEPCVLSSKMSRMQSQKEKEEEGRLMDGKVTGHEARG